jgi:hypothetical protein
VRDDREVANVLHEENRTAPPRCRGKRANCGGSSRPKAPRGSQNVEF